MNILIGVCGSISAYKCPSIANAIRNDGHNVKIILTKSSMDFVGKMAFTGQGYETFVDIDEESYTGALHVDLANWADVFLIAPLSANSLSKFSNGACDNLISATFRVFSGSGKKIVMAPAMNTKMYLNKITEKQLEKMKEFFNAVEVIPVSKKLACGDTGIGGLAKIEDILKAI